MNNGGGESLIPSTLTYFFISIILLSSAEVRPMGSSQKSEISLQHSLLPLVTAGWREEERREETKIWENQVTEKNTVRQVSGVLNWNLPGMYSKGEYLRKKGSPVN